MIDYVESDRVDIITGYFSASAIAKFFDEVNSAWVFRMILCDFLQSKVKNDQRKNFQFIGSSNLTEAGPGLKESANIELNRAETGDSNDYHSQERIKGQSRKIDDQLASDIKDAVLNL